MALGASTPSPVPAPGYRDLLSVFNAQPGATLLLSPEWVILGASDDYLAATLTERDVIVGRYIFDAFPGNPDLPEADGVANVRASLETVLANKQPHDMAPQHYDVPDRTQPGRFVERHWKPRHTPVLDAAGQVQYIIQSVQDITASRLAAQQLRESEAREQQARAEAEQQRQRLHEVLHQAPVAIALLEGPTYHITLANPTVCELWDRPAEQLLGRPLLEALPELRGQGVDTLLNGVLHTGEPFFGTERPFQLLRHGRPETILFNFAYQPQRNTQGAITGVLVVATDVTAVVHARQLVEAKEQETAALNEELAAANEEIRANNDQLHHAQAELLFLNQELEARIQDRTRDVEMARADAEEQRNRLERLFQQAPAHINLYAGPDHVWTLVHPATAEKLGHRPLLGLPRRQALSELPEEQHALLDRVYRTGEPLRELESRRRLDLHNDGVLHDQYFDFTYQPLFDGAGRIDGVMSFGVDVTDRVQARQRADALQAQVLAAVQRQAHERQAFQDVFEQTPALIALLRSPGHRFEYVNPAYQQLFPGRPLVGHDLAVAVPELREQGFVAVLDRVYRTGETYFGEEVSFTPADPEARLHYYNFTYQAYREAGEIAGVSIFAYDVTPQVQARQQREVQRQQLYDLFMQAPAAICILDGPDLVYELANPGYQDLFPDRELLGRPLLDALPEIAGHAVYHGFRAVYDTGVTREEKALLIPLARPGDGVLEDRYFNYIQQPRLDTRGRPDGVLVFAFEVTEQVQARQQAQAMAAELRDTNHQLTRTNVDLDNFIYTASHDLKAPISNIEGLLYLLQEELPPAVTQDTEVGPTLTRMLDAVERFKRTIEHLTDVSKLQKEHTLAATLVNLAAVIEDVRQDLAPLLQATGAKVVVDVPAMPAIQFSEKNLRSIVYNLLSNAVKYHSPDRPPRVDVRGHVRPGHTVLEVHDNGLGMAAHQLPKLFGMFQRFHDHVDGSGIGLYMVKRMVENAGGRIEVHSQLGAGTTFFVFLPHTATAGAPPFPAYLPS